MTLKQPSEQGLIETLRTYLKNGYRVSQQDAYGGVYSWVRLHHPMTGDTLTLEWDA